MIVTAVGAAASLLSIASFLPQAWKIWKTRETEGLSTKMWIFNVTAFALWTVYGISLGKWPLIATNSICLVLAAFILTMKITARKTASP